MPSVGTDQTLEVATWNIENFPKDTNTPTVVTRFGVGRETVGSPSVARWAMEGTAGDSGGGGRNDAWKPRVVTNTPTVGGAYCSLAR